MFSIEAIKEMKLEISIKNREEKKGRINKLYQ